MTKWDKSLISVRDPQFIHLVTEHLMNNYNLIVRACLHNCGGMRVEALITSCNEYDKFLSDFLYKKPQTKISINFYPANVKKDQACLFLVELCKLTSCLDKYALATECANGIYYINRVEDGLCRTLATLGDKTVYLLSPPLEKHYTYHGLIPFSDGSATEGNYND